MKPKLIFQWKPYLLFCLGFFLLIGAETVFGFQDDGIGDASRGGRLYQAWDLELGIELGDENQPLWETQDENNKNGATTWRCSTCHGSDYKGVDGVSNEGTEGYTGFPGIFRASNFPLDEILSWLNGTKNSNHDFSIYLNTQDMEDMSTFIQAEMFDMELLIDNEVQDIVGEGSRGEVLYKANCRECHGTEGAKINFGSIDSPIFLGNVVNNNPWRTIHIVKFGHISVEAPNAYTLNWNIIDLADILDYLLLLPRTLSEEPELEEVIDYSYQGNTIAMIRISLSITVVVFLGILWKKYLLNRNEKY